MNGNWNGTFDLEPSADEIEGWGPWEEMRRIADEMPWEGKRGVIWGTVRFDGE